MSKAVFDRIKDIEGYPCVTLAMPTHRAKPDSLQDPTRLSNLIREADRRLRQEGKNDEAEAIGKQLQQVEAQIDHNYNLEGLLVFAHPEMATFARVPFSVEERAVIDHNFATRDLMRGFHLAETYYVMTLSWDKIRLLRGMQDKLTEVTEKGFPFHHNFGVTDRVDWSISDYRNAQTQEFFNRVDKAFVELHNEEPGRLVLAGVEDNIHHYQAVADRPSVVFAEVKGNFDDASEAQIAEAVWPVVEQKLDEEKTKAVSSLDKAIGAGKAAMGIQDVYPLARQGRGATLLVERGYYQPAQVKVDEMQMAHVNLDVPTDGPGVIDDLVDEAAEQVIKHQGDVVFLDDGTLSDHGQIALVLRY